MSRQRKKTIFVPKSYESAKGAGDTSASIYESMLLHPQYKRLTYRQRSLYDCMKAQLYGKSKPRETEAYRDIPEVGANEVFFFGIDDAIKYGFATVKNHGDLYRDIKKLIELGFIDKLCDGKRGQWRAVYRLSGRWHTDSS